MHVLLLLELLQFLLLFLFLELLDDDGTRSGFASQVRGSDQWMGSRAFINAGASTRRSSKAAMSVILQ